MEQSCLKSFDTLDDLEMHVSLGHHFQTTADSGLVRSLQFLVKICLRMDSTQKVSDSGAPNVSIGWALQPAREAPKKFPDV